mmetsp:Transcript_41201/g.66964  ORF Transcript_41201/g.66964 Transcript_41201/m.66964 type:complete len:1009 (+) Transcript_41201:74-3100(+)
MSVWDRKSSRPLYTRRLGHKVHGRYSLPRQKSQPLPTVKRAASLPRRASVPKVVEVVENPATSEAELVFRNAGEIDTKIPFNMIVGIRFELRHEKLRDELDGQLVVVTRTHAVGLYQWASWIFFIIFAFATAYSVHKITGPFTSFLVMLCWGVSVTVSFYSSGTTITRATQKNRPRALSLTQQQRYSTLFSSSSTNHHGPITPPKMLYTPPLKGSYHNDASLTKKLVSSMPKISLDRDDDDDDDVGGSGDDNDHHDHDDQSFKVTGTMSKKLFAAADALDSLFMLPPTPSVPIVRKRSRSSSGTSKASRGEGEEEDESKMGLEEIRGGTPSTPCRDVIQTKKSQRKMKSNLLRNRAKSSSSAGSCRKKKRRMQHEANHTHLQHHHHLNSNKIKRGVPLGPVINWSGQLSVFYLFVWHVPLQVGISFGPRIVGCCIMAFVLILLRAGRHKALWHERAAVGPFGSMRLFRPPMPTFPIRIIFSQAHLPKLFDLRSAILAIPEGRKAVRDVAVGGYWTEGITSALLPSGLYNNTRLRQLGHVIINFLIPAFFILQGLSVLVPWAWGHAVTLSALLGKDIGVHLLKRGFQAISRMFIHSFAFLVPDFGRLFSRLAIPLRLIFSLLSGVVKSALRIVLNYIVPSDTVLTYARARFAELQSLASPMLRIGTRLARNISTFVHYLTAPLIVSFKLACTAISAVSQAIAFLCRGLIGGIYPIVSACISLIRSVAFEPIRIVIVAVVTVFHTFFKLISEIVRVIVSLLTAALSLMRALALRVPGLAKFAKQVSDQLIALQKRDPLFWYRMRATALVLASGLVASFALLFSPVIAMTLLASVSVPIMLFPPFRDWVLTIPTILLRRPQFSASTESNPPSSSSTTSSIMRMISGDNDDDNVTGGGSIDHNDDDGEGVGTGILPSISSSNSSTTSNNNSSQTDNNNNNSKSNMMDEKRHQNSSNVNNGEIEQKNRKSRHYQISSSLNANVAAASTPNEESNHNSDDEVVADADVGPLGST